MVADNYWAKIEHYCLKKNFFIFSRSPNNILNPDKNQSFKAQ